MDDEAQNDVRGSYDRVADEYVSRIFDELRHKPLDCELLDRFATLISAGQLVCDLGCGPGQVGHYLQKRGVRVCGVDLSPEMITRARALNPNIDFTCADMRALPVSNSSWAGIVAFYAIVNLAATELESVFGEIQRALQPDGLLLLSFHIGDETVHLSDWWDIEVSIDFHFFRTEQVITALQAAGFNIEELKERLPYPDVEHQSRRAYILARKLTETTGGVLRHSAGNSDVFRLRRNTTVRYRTLLVRSRIAVRFLKHDFRAENSYHSCESISFGRRLAKKRERPEHLTNEL